MRQSSISVSLAILSVKAQFSKNDSLLPPGNRPICYVLCLYFS